MPSPHRPQIVLTEAQKRIILQLRIKGPTPRVHLASMLRMNTASMTRTTQQLVAMGMLEELDVSDASARGRPTVPLAIAGRGGWSAGATVHPGWLELIVMDFAGHPVFHDSIPFDDPDPRVFARTIDARLRALIASHGFLRGKFLGLGVAVPGYALGDDRSRRQVVKRLSGWNDVPLLEIFDDTLDMPIWIENDGTAAALAEYYQPRIIGVHRSVLVFFLGQGMGAGLIAERDLFLGEHGNSGEVGRLFPGDDPRPSGIDLMLRLREAGVKIDSLAELNGLLDSQEDLIERWVERVARQLEEAAFSGQVWLDPGAVIISGAIPHSILQQLASRVARFNAARDPGYRGQLPEFHASSIGSKAVVMGAAMAPIHAITALG
jgi:predicted NBD/HSP70 family sugar kinase